MMKIPTSLTTGLLGFFLLILSVSTQAQWRGPQNVNMLSEAAWARDSNGTTTINICWENLPGNEAGAQWVKDAIERTWQAEADLEFRDWGPCNSYSKGIRILIKDETAAPHTNGLGTQLEGQYGGMVLNFTFRNFRCSLSTESCVKFIAVHEFGHALGLAHEHNRADCLCGEKPQGGDGTLYVTSCDMDSVMNYCNKRWNNYGILSDGDKTGIRTVYGEKRQGPRYDRAQSLISVSDTLSSGQTSQTGAVEQLWENVYVEIGGSGQLLHVDKTNPSQTRTWNFAPGGTATYPFKVWSYTIQNEFLNGRFVRQAVRLGYGEGSVYLTKGNSYSLAVYIKEQPNSWNPAGYVNLVLK